MSPSLPLPADEDLPEEIRAALANLPPLNVFRAVASVPASFRPFLELGGSLLGGPRSTRATARSRSSRSPARPRHLRARAARAARGDRRGLGGEIAAIRDGDASALDADGALAHRAATEISRDVRISDEALAALVERWGNAGAAELILCAAYYNMVSRFPRVDRGRARVRATARPAVAGRHPQARRVAGAAHTKG